MKTTYFVSGFMRCGTSMMMQALEAGGLVASYDKSRNSMNDEFGDEFYKPNEGGFYELSAKDYAKLNFPKDYEGTLVKCLMGGITNIVPGNYKIVFMRRNFEEIRQSYEAFFNRPLNIKKEETFEELVAKNVGILKQRRDVVVEEIWFKDVVENPVKEFKRIADMGFPVDVEKASKIVKPDLRRFKLEDLEIDA